MRFGKTLSLSIYPPWKDKYIEYDKLKKLLREDETSPQGRGSQDDSNWTEQDEENFVNELTNTQLEKVHQHQADTFSSLRDRTAACESKLQPTADDAETEAADDEKKKEIARETLKELDEISKEITELKKYSRVNYTGFLKAAKKHDRKRGRKYRVRPILQVRMSQVPFNTEDYSPLLYRLSTMYAWSRQILEGEDPHTESNTSVRPKDTYTAHKFWVHQDNLLELKTYILRRLPVLVYNPQSLKVVDGSQKDPTITSIYFDNDKFDLYQEKVDRAEESGSLRFRWTSQLADSPEILIEKKIVNEKTGSRDIRLPIKEKHIKSFLAGENKLEKQLRKLEERHGAGSEEAENFKSTVDEIQQFIKDKRLEPLLRATYTRTAFQIPGDDRIRVSIDTNLALIREDALDTDRPCRDPDDWHRSDIDEQRMEYPYSAIKKGEIARFEHAILEIKVKDSKYTQNNSWLNDLMSSHLVKEAPKFSKFVHGVAELFEDYVNSFPFWLSDLETDIRRDPETAFQEEQDKQQRKAEDEMAVGSFLPPSKLSGSKGRFGSPGKLPERRVSSGLLGLQGMSTSVASKAPQTQETIEERDSDDDGIQGNSVGVTDSSKRSGLMQILPAFSNSRYAQRHRKGAARKDAPLPPGVKDPGVWIKDQGPLKVEAKVWLANQRTFIKWLHVAVLLGTLSLGLGNAAGKNNTIASTLSIVYTVIAVFAACWGIGVYLWRSQLITQRSGRDFDALTGPYVVAIALCVALILNFVFKYASAREKTRGEGFLGLALVAQEL
ncbi:Phosphate metabolism transcription protein [Neophaeococcomyces mojaviensis]|uniref:Phosphate metabolism transcription protein n=1 Tax=Neophaeococcomyces mojaviensis TaxID=3383035 RepID=A0ACC3AD55_9EURO|nr:Phosphate metabolism transcription protein [Knufia sp. JES_112]